MTAVVMGGVAGTAVDVVTIVKLNDPRGAELLYQLVAFVQLEVY